MVAMREKELEAKLVKLVEAVGGKCLKWVCPGWAGVPDRIVLLPHGRVAFVEMKRPAGGRLSERQKWWGDTLRKMGFNYCVIWDIENLNTFYVTVVLGGD